MGYVYISVFVFNCTFIVAQFPVRCLTSDNFDSSTCFIYANRKQIPDDIKCQTLQALSCYSELKETKIIFRYRKRVTPLSSRPLLLSLLRKRENRIYLITISSKTKKRISPILLSNLPFNAQVGVLGHELAHILDFSKKSTKQLITLFFKKFKSKYTDQFEFNTDLICINHGLGFQLYDWSEFVREALNIKEWKGASDSCNLNEIKQRYMNPQTIEKYMCVNPIYRRFISPTPN
jgi:hypothetical protein